jgi:hypothetical protein
LLKNPVNHALHHPNPTEEEGLISRDNHHAAHQEGLFFNSSIHEGVEFIEKKKEEGPKLLPL